MDAIHGYVVRNTRLRLLGSERFVEFCSDRQGCVDVALRPDDYLLTIGATDHEPLEVGTVTLAHGESVDLGDLPLAPGSARLRGRTSAQDFLPEPYRVELLGPHCESQDVAPGESFSFDGLVSGHYRLSWWRPKRVGVRQSLECELSVGECSEHFLDTEALVQLRLHLRDRAGRPFRGACRHPGTSALVLAPLELEFYEGRTRTAGARIPRGA